MSAKGKAKTVGKRLLRLWLWKWRLAILGAMIPALLVGIVFLAILGASYTPANAAACTSAVQGQYTKTIADDGNGPNMNIAVVAYQTTVLRTKTLPPDQAKKVLDSIFQAGLTESGFKNYANSSVPVSMNIPHDAVGHDGTSVGYLQQQVGPMGDGGGFSWGTAAEAMDPVHATNMYLDRAIDLVGRTAGDASTLAQSVQESQFDDGSNYRDQVDTAQGLILRAQTAAAGPAGAAQALTLIKSCAPAQGGTFAGGNPTNQGAANGVVLDSVPDTTPISVVNPAVSTALTEAHRWLGRPYCWAGGDASGPTAGDGSSPGCSSATPGFDCSGLMVRSWAVAGITLPRVSRYQATAGVRVPVEQARPGDLLFWSNDGSDDAIHHVAMVDKEKGWIVEAQQDGVPVHVRTWRVGEAELMPYAVRLTP